MKQHATRHVVLALVLGASGLCGCGGSKPAPAPVTAQAAAPPVAPNPAEDTGFTASGPIVVENQVDVAAQREGVVAKIAADTGTPVRAGQLLAQLDDRQVAAERDGAGARVKSLEAEVKYWEADVRVLQSDRDRAQKMWEAQLITKQDLEHAEFRLAADSYQVQQAKENLRHAQETLEGLNLELEKTRIRAPFRGVVARRYVREGQKVAVGDRMFWVTAVAPLRVKFALPERYLGSLKKGDEVALSSADLPGNKYTAKVILISPVVDPASGTIDVTAEVAGPAEGLRPGMLANIRVPNQR